MQALIVADATVLRDPAGRYCLNDLHRAAGGEPRHQPSIFMRRKATAELATAFNSADLLSLPGVTVEGRKGGNFVAKELVYAYGRLISRPSICWPCGRTKTWPRSRNHNT
jgi:hypothetical protein